MKNQNLADHLPLSQRAGFLRDNCDEVENISYLKKFKPDEIGEMKNRLSEVSIEANDIEEEKKLIVAQIKAKKDPLVAETKLLLTNIKNKAILVKEECFKFLDQEEGRVRFYNAVGDLVDERPMMPSERQTTIFRAIAGAQD